jgi:putative Mg2+ transporter-C (MgtC) family protein
MVMSPSVSATDVAIRLGLAVVIGIILGFDRSTHGKAAGMRTTVLVCVAAAIAMIQVNMLLLTAGRPSGSFVMNDLMRLPLGILTGIGFIGGGAILRRGSIVVGVTTAATIWLATVIGLTVGGGQLWLGVAGTAIGVFALRFLAWVEDGLKRQYDGRLELQLDTSRTGHATVRSQLDDLGVNISKVLAFTSGPGPRASLVFEVRITQAGRRAELPQFVARLATEPGVMKVDLLELS